MRILLGAEVSIDEINAWVEEVNNEFDLSEHNWESVDYFVKIKNFCVFILEPDWYAVLMFDSDMWGNRELQVISYYIRKEKRSFKTFREINKKFEELARAFDCRYLLQGSHLDKRLFDYLGKSGYKLAVMKKEL